MVVINYVVVVVVVVVVHVVCFANQKHAIKLEKKFFNC